MDEKPCGNRFLELLWLNLKFSNLSWFILNIEIPVFREIHNSLILFLLIISKLLMYPSSIELKPADVS